VVSDAAQQGQVWSSSEHVARWQHHLTPGVFGDQRDLFVVSRFDARVGSQADRRVQRLRAGVKEIEWPDVDGAASQIDSRGRGRGESHDAIIIPRRLMPLATRRDIGQLLIGSFLGTSLPVELRSLAREFDLGGIILFSRNIEAPEQVAELAGEAEGLGRELPAWVSVDQEGGRVARLKAPFTVWPPMATLGRSGSAPLAERFAAALAAELPPWASRSTTRRSSTSTPTRRTR
jgi:hypothetical protein